MAGSMEGRSVAFFVLFLFVFAPFTSLAPSASIDALEEITAPTFVGENTPVDVDIRPGQTSQNPFELTLPSSSGSITNLEMTMQSTPLQNSQTSRQSSSVNHTPSSVGRISYEFFSH